MSDRLSARADGVRIAASRAGGPDQERRGEDWHNDLDDAAWARVGAPEPVTAGRSSRASRRSKGADVGGDGDATRRRGRRGRRRSKEERAPGAGLATPLPPPVPSSPPLVVVAPAAAAVPSVARPMALGRQSPARLKVLRQRRRRRRSFIACTFLTTVATFVVGVGYVYVQGRLERIKRLELGSLTQDTPGATMNVLLVSSDTPVGTGGAEQASAGLGELIMVLHVDPRQQTAAIVSVPPNLLVPISPTGNVDRISTAYVLGGADQLLATVQSALHITINHYAEVDFTGYKDIVDALGGVTLYVPYPVRDATSGLALGTSGCVSLDGDQSLALVRSRQAEFLVDGTWKADGRGDLGRVERQQDFIHRMTREALGVGVTHPIQLNRLLGAAGRAVTFDSALSTTDISALGERFNPLDPDKVMLLALPTSPVQVNGKSVQLLQLAQSQPTLDLLNGTATTAAATTTVPTSVPATTITTAKTTTGAATGPMATDVRIRILNGVGTPGAASKAATGLTAIGFTVADKGDATSILPKTMIMYGTGQLAKAQLLQGSLVTTAVLKEDATLKAVDLNLVLGGDFTGVKSGISSGASAAPTTVVTTTIAVPTSPAPPRLAQTTPPC